MFNDYPDNCEHCEYKDENFECKNCPYLDDDFDLEIIGDFESE